MKTDFAFFPFLPTAWALSQPLSPNQADAL